MDTLQDVVSDIRIFLYGGMTTLPLTLAGTMLLLGLFTANYAMMFFLLGYLLLSPLPALALNLLFPPHNALPNVPNRCKLDMRRAQPTSDQVSDAAPEDDTSYFTTVWMSMISFFIGYMINNAYGLFSKESPDKSLLVTSDGDSINSKIIHRKSQAMMAFLSIIVFSLIVIYFRYSTSCDPPFGILITFIASGAAGYGWYSALSGIGQDRLSDLFGIANRLLPPSAIQNQPIACLPIVPK
jgi:hypothetical protein